MFPDASSKPWRPPPGQDCPQTGADPAERLFRCGQDKIRHQGALRDGRERQAHLLPGNDGDTRRIDDKPKITGQIAPRRISGKGPLGQLLMAADVSAYYYSTSRPALCWPFFFLVFSTLSCPGGADGPEADPARRACSGSSQDRGRRAAVSGRHGASTGLILSRRAVTSFPETGMRGAPQDHLKGTGHIGHGQTDRDYALTLVLGTQTRRHPKIALQRFGNDIGTFGIYVPGQRPERSQHVGGRRNKQFPLHFIHQCV